MDSVNHFVGTFSDISLNDALISNALQHKSSICNFPLKYEDEQGTDKVESENNGICGNFFKVQDVRIHSNNSGMSLVSEEKKVTNSYSESECVIEKENLVAGNDSEQDPLLLNEEDLSRKIILERIDSTSSFPSNTKKEEPDVLAASLLNGNENECSLAKVTSFPITKENSGDVVNVKEKGAAVWGPQQSPGAFAEESRVAARGFALAPSPSCFLPFLFFLFFSHLSSYFSRHHAFCYFFLLLLTRTQPTLLLHPPLSHLLIPVMSGVVLLRTARRSDGTSRRPLVIPLHFQPFATPRPLMRRGLPLLFVSPPQLPVFGEMSGRSPNACTGHSARVPCTEPISPPTITPVWVYWTCRASVSRVSLSSSRLLYGTVPCTPLHIWCFFPSSALSPSVRRQFYRVSVSRDSPTWDEGAFPYACRAGVLVDHLRFYQCRFVKGAAKRPGLPTEVTDLLEAGCPPLAACVHSFRETLALHPSSGHAPSLSGTFWPSSTGYSRSDWRCSPPLSVGRRGASSVRERSSARAFYFVPHSFSFPYYSSSSPLMQEP